MRDAMKGYNMSMHVEDKIILTTLKKTLLDKVRAKLDRFRNEETGSLIIFSLFLLIMMLMISGMAVDLMRAETQRARLQATLDRAVLAGAGLSQSLDGKEVVLDYFEKAGLSQYIDPDDVIADPVTGSTRMVSAAAFASVDTFFMGLLGIESLGAPASGAAAESLGDIEISLILDVSGSMGDPGSNGALKIDTLISAAQEFVYMMQCDPDTDDEGVEVCGIPQPNESISISIIPYSEQVQVGEELLQQFNVTNEHTSSSCVDFKEADFSTVAIQPAATLQRAGHFDGYSSYNRRNPGPYTFPCRTDSWRQILPFQSNYGTLQTYIGNLGEGGWTSIDVGMKWGAAMLDPAFAPAVTNLSAPAVGIASAAFDGRPASYSDGLMQKVIVLMTDGMNTRRHALLEGFNDGPSPFYANPEGGVISVYSNVSNRYHYPHEGDYTDSSTWHDIPYGIGGVDTETVCTGNRWNRVCTDVTTPQEGISVQMDYTWVWANYRVSYYKRKFPFLASPVHEVVDGLTKDTYLDTLCAQVRARGIDIYTIGFETTSASDLVLGNCAGETTRNFAVGSEDLDDAFAAIARDVHKLRLIN